MNTGLTKNKVADHTDQCNFSDKNNFGQPHPEPIYFNLHGNWYKGKVPAFYDVSEFEITRILEGNYELIKKEILSFYANETTRFEPMYVPHDYVNTKWRVFNFYGFMLRHPGNLRKFPVLSNILESIPNMVGAQISVLEPHTRIKAHISGSNALIRNHLGIVVPGKYPEIGIRVRQEERCWEEGRVMAFSESHRHYAWNYTDHVRIVLLVDTIHPDYADKKRFICAASLAVLVMKMITAKFPVTKKIPVWLTHFFHKLFTVPFYILFFLQEKCNINLSSTIERLKFKKKK